jgi:ornithine carbamoyltransferase
MPRHFLNDLDLSPKEQAKILDRAQEMKKDPRAFATTLAGRVLAMIFQKSSTRTRVSFEAGMVQLGGHAIFLSPRDIQMGRGEPVPDTGAVLSRYCDAIMIRTFAHEEIQTLAKASRVPVINGLDDLLHPCQVLADLQTLREARGTAAGQTLVYVGDGNNVAHSLMLGGATAGTHVRIVCPEGFAPKREIVEQAQARGRETGAKIEVAHDLAAVAGADAVYTDVWASMGQEAEAERRKQAFAGWTVDAKLMKKAKPDAIFLHCLPAHRGEEVSAEVIDGAQSRVFDQAENRLHAQKALLTFLLT